jgi:DNA mismatch endonuclease (patch repair protein)
MDKLDPKRRSENMRRIRSKHTKPEVLLRSMLHRRGYRFRLHSKNLPGRPDLVFPSRRKAIFVHGCFWHQHKDCREGRPPGTRQDYWLPKFERNRLRHEAAEKALRLQGWDLLVVWECAIEKGGPEFLKHVETFLGR